MCKVKLLEDLEVYPSVTINSDPLQCRCTLTNRPYVYRKRERYMISTKSLLQPFQYVMPKCEVAVYLILGGRGVVGGGGRSVIIFIPLSISHSHERRLRSGALRARTRRGGGSTSDWSGPARAVLPSFFFFSPPGCDWSPAVRIVLLVSGSGPTHGLCSASQRVKRILSHVSA